MHGIDTICAESTPFYCMTGHYKTFLTLTFNINPTDGVELSGHFGTSAELSHGHFGIGAKCPYETVTGAEMSWC